MWSMQPKVMRGRRDDAGDGGTGPFLTGPDRLRELARVAGDLGADEMVHDSIAFAERTDAAELIDAALERFTDRLIFEIDERRAALMRPPALSGSHAAELGTAISNAQLWLRDASHESADDQDALVARVKAERDRFLATFEAAAAELRDAVALTHAGRWELWPRFVERVNETARARVRQWMTAERSKIGSMYREALERYSAANQQLVERIRASGVAIESDIVVESAWNPPELDAASVAANPPLRWRSVLRAVTGSSDRAAMLEEATEILRQAMESGSARIVDAFREALILARRRMEWEVALQLRATADSLKRASDAARSAQSEGAQGIANELNRLDELANRLAKIADL